MKIDLLLSQHDILARAFNGHIVQRLGKSRPCVDIVSENLEFSICKWEDGWHGFYCHPLEKAESPYLIWDEKELQIFEPYTDEFRLPLLKGMAYLNAHPDCAFKADLCPFLSYHEQLESFQVSSD